MQNTSQSSPLQIPPPYILRLRKYKYAKGAGLSRKAQERATALSRGQLQRLALARALLHEPALLLLDEPATGLDHEGLELLTSLLQEHCTRGGTLLFTTHDVSEAVQRSEQIVMLRNGRVAYQEETQGLELAGVLQAYQEVVQ